jgi:hypothetical protein
MKLSALSVTAFFCLSLFACKGQSQVIDEAASTLRHFYISYITEHCKTADIPNTSPTLKDNLKKIDSLVNAIATNNLREQLKEQDEAGYDFFINSNNCSVEWLKTINVSKDVASENIYVVTYVNEYPVEKKIIKLRMVKRGSVFLIDRILR